MLFTVYKIYFIRVNSRIHYQYRRQRIPVANGGGFRLKNTPYINKNT